MDKFYILYATSTGHMEYTVSADNEKQARAVLREQLNIDRLPNGSQVFIAETYNQMFNCNR